MADKIIRYPNCWFCKHFSCDTYHQIGFGSRESKHCRARQMHMEEVIDANDCEFFEEGKSERYNQILG